MIRVLIVDDEPLARERLARLVSDINGYDVIGQAANGEEALRLYAETTADVVLLDIRMPGMDGVQAAQRLMETQNPPAMIFCTAYGDYAIEAFKVNAIDYLMKPVRKEALAEALARCHQLNRVQLAKLQQMDSQAAEAPPIVARSSRETKLIDPQSVFYFQADQKYVTAVHSKGETILDASLRELADNYSNSFIRIHRNCLVNTHFIEAMGRDAGGHHFVRLRGLEHPLAVSRRHATEVRNWLAQHQ